MKLKKYGYLIAIVLMLLIGINNVNAEVNKTCYYMKSDKQALSKLILEDGKANVYINKMGKKIDNDHESILNWDGNFEDDVTAMGYEPECDNDRAYDEYKQREAECEKKEVPND